MTTPILCPNEDSVLQHLRDWGKNKETGVNRAHRLSIFCVCVQEIKCCDHDNLSPYSVWDGGINVGWVTIDAVGQSRGTWSL